MTNLDQIEYYEHLEAKHRRSRIIGLVSLIVIILVGFSNQFYDSKLLYESNSENYLILAFSVVFTVHAVRTWNGSEELKFLRELFRSRK